MLVLSMHIFLHDLLFVFNCSKSSTIRCRSLIKRFPFVVNVPRSHVPVLFEMQWSVASRFAFYRGREHLWIVFSFKQFMYHTNHALQTSLSGRLFICYFKERNIKCWFFFLVWTLSVFTLISWRLVFHQHFVETKNY